MDGQGQPHTLLQSRLDEIEGRLRAVLRTYAGPPSRPHRILVGDAIMLVDLVRRAPAEPDVTTLASIAEILEIARDVRQVRGMERELRLRVDPGARRLRAVLIAGSVAAMSIVCTASAMVVASQIGDGGLLNLGLSTWLGGSFGVVSAGSATAFLSLQRRAEAGDDDLARVVLNVLSALSLSLCGAVGLILVLPALNWLELFASAFGDWAKIAADVVSKSLADDLDQRTADASAAYLAALVGGLFAREALALVFWCFAKPFYLLFPNAQHRKHVSIDSS